MDPRYYSPPPVAPPGAGSPPESPRYQAPQPGRRNRQGLAGWLTSAALAIWGVAKYGVVLLKFKAFLTLFTMLVSFGAYALFLGPWAAAAVVVMIFIHEMGHVIEIRRQGMRATAPIFIPFLGAAIFQRSHATDALKQAQIGIAGPLMGTVGATLAFAGYGDTHSPLLLFAAYFGYWINLINLIPAGMLDGGWILGAVSKWFQVLGLALVGVLVLAPELFGVRLISPFILVFILLGLPLTIARFRNAESPYYTSVPVPARVAMGVAWLALVVYTGIASYTTFNLLNTFVR